MSGISGPEYPGPRDGLVFCFDPKNPRCIPVVGGNTTTVYNMVDNAPGVTSFANNEIPTEWSGIYTPEGYILYDGTDDDIDFGDICSFEYNNPFSVNIWISPDWTANSYLVAKSRDGTSPDFNMYRGWSLQVNGSKKLVFTLSNYGWTPIGMAVEGGTTINVWGGWQSLCCTYDGSGNRSGMKLYVNGVAETLTGLYDSTLSTTMVTTFPLLIGKQAGGAKYYDGKQGSVMIYNRELTAGEVLQNYNQLKGRFGL
jgi:hypothetical protein